MGDAVQTVMLDGNIFDLLAKDSLTRDLIRDLVGQKYIRIIISPVVMQELRSSPFRGIPDFFPVDIIVESVAVVGLAIVDLAICGDGTIFSPHLGTSSKGSDAVIADSASSYANIFVSEDKRCRTRLAQLQESCNCLSYSDFKLWIGTLNEYMHQPTGIAQHG